MKAKLLTLPLFTCLLLSGNISRADDARLKETVRALTVRLRADETRLNTLAGDKAELEQQKKTLTDKVTALTKQAADDKATIDTLTSKASDQGKELLQTKEALGKWKAGYEKLAAAAQKSEGERSKLAEESILLKRRVEDLETKNLALFNLGNEILTRYEKFGLGDAVAAREPFTGIARVKLENLVQGYQDKLADQRAKK
jgi:chromosome segregation ATPase